VLDLGSAVDTAVARLAHLVVMPQAGDQFALEFTKRMQVDRIIDCLVRDSFLESLGHMRRSMFAICCGDQSCFRLPYSLKKRPIDIGLGRMARCDTPSVTLLVSKVGVVGTLTGCSA
jgi:hypothetical protein